MPIRPSAASGKGEPQWAARHDYLLLPVLFILLPVVLLLLAGALFGEPAGPPASSACRLPAVINRRPSCLVLPMQAVWPAAKASTPGFTIVPRAVAGGSMPSYQAVPSGAPVRKVVSVCERPVRFSSTVGLAYSSIMLSRRPAAAPVPAQSDSNRPLFIPNDKPLPVGYRMVAERLVQQLLDAALPVFPPCAPQPREAGSANSQAG